MLALCNILIALMDKSAKLDSNSNSRRVLCSVANEIKYLRKAIEKGHTDLSFVGKSNVGKSTIINAILGEKVAPSKNKPYTSAIVEYRYAEQYSLVMKKTREELISVQRYDDNVKLVSDIKRNATVTDESLFSSAERTLVYVPSNFLKNNVFIYDTPGYGATKGEEDESESPAGIHDHIVNSFLESTDCMHVFWIIRENFTEEIKELMYKYCGANASTVKHYVIVNTKSKDLSDEFKSNFKKNYHNELNLCDETFFINAMDAVTNAEKAEELRMWILDKILITPDKIGTKIVELLDRMAVQCREIDKCNITWSQAMFATASVKCKNRNLHCIVESLNKLSDK